MSPLILIFLFYYITFLYFTQLHHNSTRRKHLIIGLTFQPIFYQFLIKTCQETPTICIIITEKIFMKINNRNVHKPCQSLTPLWHNMNIMLENTTFVQCSFVFWYISWFRLYTKCTNFDWLKTGQKQTVTALWRKCFELKRGVYSFWISSIT